MAPCSWTLPDCGCGGCLDDLTPAQRERAVGMASLVMWAATGRRYGLCAITVQPCNPRQGGRTYQVYPVNLDGFGHGGALAYPVLEDGSWYNRGGGCGCCAGRCEVALPGPLVKANITAVTVAGAVVAADAYQVHDRTWLVRVDGQCWPTCVNYSSQDPPAFTVSYSRGEAVPAPVLAATATLACEFAKACTGAKCRLPRRIASITRQGVDVQFAEVAELLDAGLTGLDEVDQVIRAVNPAGLRQRPRVLSPDLHQPRIVT